MILRGITIKISLVLLGEVSPGRERVRNVPNITVSLETSNANIHKYTVYSCYVVYQCSLGQTISEFRIINISM